MVWKPEKHKETGRKREVNGKKRIKVALPL